jgi:hypothetical protein
MYQTVLRTALYLAGIYGFNNACIALVAGMFRKMLNFTLVRVQLPTETWGEFHHRMNSKTAELTKLFGKPSVEDIIIKQHIGWLGHIGRQSARSPVSVAMSWRDAAWWQEVQNDVNRPRYLHRGVQVAQSTDLMFEHLGPFWRELVWDRAQWRQTAAALKKAVDTPEILDQTVHPALRPFEFVSTISNKLFDFTGGRLGTRLSGGPFPLVVVCDCLHMVQMITGKAFCGPPLTYLEQSVEKLRWVFYLLEHRLPLQPVFSAEGILVHRPRADNTLADCVANWVLNEKAHDYLWINRVLRFLPAASVLRVHSDGAFRASGEASCAAVVTLDFCTEEGTWATVVLGVRGRVLRVEDRMCTVAEGLLAAAELLVDILRVCRAL